MTRRFAVIGSPISHSKSPTLHSAIYRSLSLDAVYDRIDIPKIEFERFCQEEIQKYDGISVTMPLKELAFDFAHSHDEDSLKIHASNTLIKKDGIWHAANTDVLGIRNLVNSVKNIESLSIVGAGATAKAAIAAVPNLPIKLFARDLSKLGSVQEKFENVIALHPWSSLHQAFESDFLINATPKGVLDDFVVPRNSDMKAFLDVNYDPWPTTLVTQMDPRVQIFSGIDLLVEQAIHQVLLMWGPIVEINQIRSLMKNAVDK